VAAVLPHRCASRQRRTHQFQNDAARKIFSIILVTRAGGVQTDLSAGGDIILIGSLNPWCPRPELNWDQRFRKQFSLLHDGKQKTIAIIGHS
jgi:hypothetical protein